MEDIGAEVRCNLEAEIDDQARVLGRKLRPDEVSALLKRHGHPTAGGRFSFLIEWNGEYVRCTFTSSAARPVAGAAAIRARSLSRFFVRC